MAVISTHTQRHTDSRHLLQCILLTNLNMDLDSMNPAYILFHLYLHQCSNSVVIVTSMFVCLFVSLSVRSHTHAVELHICMHVVCGAIARGPPLTALR